MKEKGKETFNVRKSAARGVTDLGWLQSHHTFSFGDYHDSNHMGFRALRVINDDVVRAGEGFGTHPHRDMEIISYVIDGALEHKDSMGNGSVIKPNDVQRMSAGTGVTHSEFNPQENESVHFLQIWIVPKHTGTPPGYEQINVSVEEKVTKLKLIASPDGAEDSVTIDQDTRLYATILEPGCRISQAFECNRYIWVHVVKGKLTVNSEELSTGDGVAIEGIDELALSGIERSEVLVFDLA